MIFNLASIINWQVVAARKQRQVNIDNVRKNTNQLIFDYAIGDLVYVDETPMHCKLDYDKHGPYRIT